MRTSRSGSATCSARSPSRGGRWSGGSARRGAGAGGEAGGEGGPLAGPALGAEAALVRLDDVAADRQAQARAPLAGGVGAGLGGEERLEDPPQVGRGDADARIGDAQLRQAA